MCKRGNSQFFCYLKKKTSIMSFSVFLVVRIQHFGGPTLNPLISKLFYNDLSYKEVPESSRL